MDYPQLHLLIGGRRLRGAGRATLPVVNPATLEVLGEVPLASPADLDRALQGAWDSWRCWRALAPPQRGRMLGHASRLLRERREAIARVATMEEGKTLAEARWELDIAADTLEWYGEEGRRTYGRVLPQASPGVRMSVVREPVGPVAGFAPWNFPLGNPARKLAAPLAAGCTVVVKADEQAPASALAIAQALLDAGVPDGVLSVVFGVPQQLAHHLIDSPLIRAVSFTGSVAVGRQLAARAAAGMKRTTMELGGHAPVLVFDDVDVDHVLDLAVATKIRNAGQICVSPTRFYVHEAIYERFAAGLAARLQAVRLGNGLDEGVQMGPLAHARRPVAVATLVEDAIAAGAKCLAGGDTEARQGLFFPPVVLGDVPDGCRVMNEEPFGPVAVLQRFSAFDEAIASANRLPYGLAAYAFTRDARRVNLIGEQVEAGMVGINSFTIAVPEAPFGGVKDSGHGAEEGIEGLDGCLVTKFITES